MMYVAWTFSPHFDSLLCILFEPILILVSTRSHVNLSSRLINIWLIRIIIYHIYPNLP